jgi:phage host-nuclease inhibitor protein Gam
VYHPALLGVARLHYIDKRAAVDHWETLALLQRIDDALPVEPWAGSEPFDDVVPELDKLPEPGACFAPLPGELARAKNYGDWTKALKNYLYRERMLQVWFCSALKGFSRLGETEREFRLRLVQASREKRDQSAAALQAKYAPKLEALQRQIDRACDRLAREEAQANRSTWDATIALGSSVLGALLGRKTISATSVTRAASAAKATGRAAQQRGQVNRAEETIGALQQKYASLQASFQDEITALDATLRPEALLLTPVPLRPKKADITVERVVLAWIPWKIGTQRRLKA